MKTDDISAMVISTATGDSARLLAKNRPPCPVVAISPDLEIVRRCCLYYGAIPQQMDLPSHSDDLLVSASDSANVTGSRPPGSASSSLPGHRSGRAGRPTAWSCRN